MTQIEINWNRGRMILHLEKFFPATIRDIKKLKSIIELGDYGNRGRIIGDIAEFLEKEIQKYRQLKDTNALKYLDFMQIKADIQQIVDTGKFSNGVPASEKELSVLKKEIKCLKKNTQRSAINAKKYQKLLERLEKNQKVVKEW